MILILAHLFRKMGKQIGIEDAVQFLSFRCRYGQPSDVRKMLSLALRNGIISRDGETINAEFLFHEQTLPLNMTTSMNIQIRDSVEPMF